MGIKKKKYVNALGGSTSIPEKSIDTLFTKDYSHDRLDTYRATVIGFNDNDTYNIRLYETSEVVKFVPVLHMPDKPYLRGTELIIGYVHGLRQQIVIFGKVHGKAPDNNNNASGNSDPLTTSYQAKKSFFALSNAKLIMYEDYDFFSSGISETSDIVKKIKQHSALSGSELHITKVHDHSEAIEGGSIVRGIRDMTRITVATLLDSDNRLIFADTDGGAITVTLPAGVTGSYYEVVNTGSSGNDVTITPDGLELLLGENSSIILLDGDALDITFETTEGWY